MPPLDAIASRPSPLLVDEIPAMRSPGGALLGDEGADQASRDLRRMRRRLIGAHGGKSWRSLQHPRHCPRILTRWFGRSNHNRRRAASIGATRPFPRAAQSGWMRPGSSERRRRARRACMITWRTVRVPAVFVCFTLRLLSIVIGRSGRRAAAYSRRPWSLSLAAARVSLLGEIAGPYMTTRCHTARYRNSVALQSPSISINCRAILELDYHRNRRAPAGFGRRAWHSKDPAIAEASGLISFEPKRRRSRTASRDHQACRSKKSFGVAAGGSRAGRVAGPNQRL